MTGTLSLKTGVLTHIIQTGIGRQTKDGGSRSGVVYRKLGSYGGRENAI